MTEKRRRGEMPGARCRQLDRQWQPIQSPADGGNGRGVRRGQGEVWPRRLSSSDKQLHGRSRAHLLHRRGCLAIRKRQGGHGKIVLTGDTQYGATRRQNAESGVGDKELDDERCRVEQMLQVIEKQQQVLRAESRDKRFGGRAATSLAHSETLGDGGGNQRRLRNGGQRNEDRSISEC